MKEDIGEELTRRESLVTWPRVVPVSGGDERLIGLQWVREGQKGEEVTPQYHYVFPGAFQQSRAGK